MSEFIKVAKLSDLEESKPLQVDYNGSYVAIVKVQDQVYAVDDLCTHSEASLCDGIVEGCEIECPVHFARFSLKSGEVTEPPAFEDLKTYEVNINGDDVEIRD